MSVQVIYKKETKSINRGVFAIFTDENFKIFKNKKILSTNELEFLRRILKSKPKSKKKILYIDLNPEKTLILISIKKKHSNNDLENLGSSFYDFIKSNNFTFINILSETMIGNLSTFSLSTEKPTPVPHINIYIASSNERGLSTGR